MELYKFVIIFIVCIFAVSLGFVIILMGVEMFENYKEYNMIITNEELRCLKLCGEDNYFYTMGGTFKSSNCVCGGNKE